MKILIRFIFISFLFFQSYYLFAQDESRFQFGVKAGGNLYSSTLQVESGISRKVIPGYQVGLTVEYEFSDEFYLQTEVDFMTKGAILKGSGSVEGGTKEWTQRFNLQYVQMPVMIAYKMEMVTDFNVYFRGGLYVAYGIGGKSTLKTIYKGVDTKDEEIRQDSFGENGFKKFDFGIRFGSGLEFEKFTVGFDFEFGFMDVNRSSNELSTLLNGKDFKNRGVSLSLGYKF